MQTDIETLQAEEPTVLAPSIVLARKRAAWILGLCYAILVGPTLLLSGLQATSMGLLFAAVCLYFVLHGSTEQQLQSRTVAFCLISALAINSVSFATNSNSLVLSLNWLLQLFLGSMLLSTFASSGHTPATVGAYCKSLFRLIACIPYVLITQRVFSQMFCRVRVHEKYSYDDKKTIALVIVAVLLAVSHGLFVQINEEYKKCMELIFRSFWRCIEFLYELDIITLVCVSSVVACLTFAAFALVFPTSKPKLQPRAYVDLSYLNIVLLPLIVLFFIFSIFQCKLLWVDPSSLSYKELSQYVEKGFWELLVVSFLGGAVYCATMERMSPEERNAGKGRILLTLFAFELLLLTVFSHHKLIVQQMLFGFRDRRVLASFGVLLLSVSFVCYFLQARNRLSAERTFSIQYWGLTLIVLLVSSINLEQTMLTLNPIHFNYEGSTYKDYAYLFTNSTDTAASWLDLMDEAEQTGIPVPKDYYWIGWTGGYRSFCQSARYRSDQRSSTFAEMRTQIENTYGPNGGRDLRSLAKFNLSEYRAYLILRDNSVRVQRFADLIDRECNRDWREIRSVLQNSSVISD